MFLLVTYSYVGGIRATASAREGIRIAVSPSRAAGSSSPGCCGARAYLDSLSEDVALWALHGEKLEAYTKEIVTLSRANSVLRQFHQNRRAAVESGEAPTVKESLSTLE